MFLMLTMLTGEKPAICSRLSEQEYADFLHNMQMLCSFDQSRLISNITCAELSLLYHTAIHNKDTSHPQMTVAEAATALRVSVPAVSRTLKNLEKKGYIERVVNENDRRSVHICVTENGMSVLTENLVKSDNIMDQILSRFTDEELRSMIQLHTKFISAASETMFKQGQY